MGESIGLKAALVAERHRRTLRCEKQALSIWLDPLVVVATPPDVGHRRPDLESFGEVDRWAFLDPATGAPSPFASHEYALQMCGRDHRFDAEDVERDSKSSA
jgi:hypothetical protein